jgi:GMC oxidoreductase
MQVASEQIPAGARLEADVAIVGAGPAGIVLALEMASRRHTVLLIESGGLGFDSEVQRLGDTEGGDERHVAMSLATRRQIGGASNLWGGRCVPFDPVDFEPREIAGNARWPVGYDEIQRYFQRACEWCVCGDAVFRADLIPELGARTLVPGFPEGTVSGEALERWSLPTNFRKEYHAALKKASAITLVTDLTCTEVVCDGAGTGVAHLVAESIAGKSVTIVAARYVLACGGLETTRLLFASNRYHTAGLGNHAGHLGKWYMAHVEARIARVQFDTPPSATIYGYERDRTGVYLRRRLTFSQDFLQRERLPNTALWLVNPELGDPSHGSPVLSFAYLMLSSPFGKYLVAEGIRQAHLKGEGEVSVYHHMKNVVRNVGPALQFALTFGYERYLRSGRKVPGFFVPSRTNTYPLVYHGEHLPHFDSYVEPTRVRDALGMPRLRTHLHFSERDVGSVARAHRYLGDYMHDHQLGRLEFLYEDTDAAVRSQMFGGYHQAGTTRMSSHPDDGVVDSNLAVHGVRDLYVASSSTFVTSGQANSTFMIVAFVLRLADELQRQLA